MLKCRCEAISHAIELADFHLRDALPIPRLRQGKAGGIVGADRRPVTVQFLNFAFVNAGMLLVSPVWTTKLASIVVVSPGPV
jgi:hypothetical protein